MERLWQNGHKSRAQLLFFPYLKVSRRRVAARKQRLNDEGPIWAIGPSSPDFGWLYWSLGSMRARRRPTLTDRPVPGANRW